MVIECPVCRKAFEYEVSLGDESPLRSGDYARFTCDGCGSELAAIVRVVAIEDAAPPLVGPIFQMLGSRVELLGEAALGVSACGVTDAVGRRAVALRMRDDKGVGMEAFLTEEQWASLLFWPCSEDAMMLMARRLLERRGQTLRRGDGRGGDAW